MKPRPTSATPAARTPAPLPGSGRSGLPSTARHGGGHRRGFRRPGRPLDRLLPWLLAAGWGGLAIFGCLFPALRPVFLAVCVIAGVVAFIASAHDPP